MRPLTAAVAAAGKGTYVLDGVARMRERPIQDLVDGLNQLGVKATCTLGTGCPPVEVHPPPAAGQGGWVEKIEEGIVMR
jgi:3-phosphoshikimate 1-carboxyvinyltransferase